ncbi:alpha/beta fold hydrolase [candidate division CSSED10-310 bacterium]|uniref:Alpha/beta fold hydrolase n=1 Tax=candidate division CSSED10-310 bacterium TaxID=2855610 RepID=A0ABV6YUM6_UNCC1
MQIRLCVRNICHHIRTGLIVQIMILLFITGTSGASMPPMPEFEPCQLTPDGGQSSIQAKCTEIVVPEDPENPGGRKISLRLVIVPAKHRNKAPDPLFLLAGGPGQAISEAFPSLAGSFEKIREDRDLVLLDQRGTGGSHPLECSESDDIPLSDQASIESLRNYLETLDVDLSFYTTEYFLGDLEYVRKLMGYEQINLYGASYGTRVAQEYLRLYPQRVRSMILDAVVPPGYRVFYDFRETIPQALEKMLNRCDEDPHCSAAFPDLRQELLTVLDRLDVEPVPIQLHHPKTGQPLELIMTRERFLKCLLPHLYAPETVALLPLSIHAAYEYGDFLPLAGQATSLDMGIYIGVMIAATCAEDVSFFPPESQWPVVGPLDFSSLPRMLCTICAEVNVKEATAPVEPDSSAVPVLLLSGDSDPVTPPDQAERAMKTLTNSLHISVPNMYHGLITRGCISDIAAIFIETGSVKALDTSCAQEIRPAPFFINPNGPSP